MTIYEAFLTEIRGHRAAELRFRLNRADHHARRVLLVEEIPLADAVTLPFVWRFAHESEEEPAPVLTVVAAPGTSVQLEGFPNPYIAGPGLPDVNIYRVQDPAVLPRLAADAPAVRFVGTYEVAHRPLVAQLSATDAGDPPATVTLALDTERHFIVEQRPNSVVIDHVGSGDRWSIIVPALTTDPRVAADARARFAFELDIEARPGDAERPMLKIVATPEVRVTLTERTARLRIFGRDLNPQFRLNYHALWQVDAIHQVPPLGAPIEPGPGWRPGRHEQEPNPEERVLALEQVVLDLIVGFTPVVGDAVDVAEFLYGVITGRNKWGNPLSLKDLALLGISAALPFVGSGAISGARRLVRRFAEHADDAAGLAQRINQANLSAADRAVIQQIEALIKTGRRPPRQLWDKALAILRRIPGPWPTLDTLLNAERTGFAHVELQAAYWRYLGAQVRRRRPVQGPVGWARSVKGGRPRELFTLLLGPEYARRLVAGDGPLVNLLDIGRPAELTDELLAAQRAVLLRSPRLWERLARLLGEPVDAGAASLGLLRRHVSAGRFRILKGNAAEIFALPIQHAELARIAKEHPTAVLVSGVRVRLKDGNDFSPRLLFSDNIIVAKQGNRVRVLAVFEVKSGFRGGEEAAEQIFEWIEGRFTDGSQLILPKGTTFTAANGRTWTSRREIAYTWKPQDPNVPTVTGLGSAGERHLITAKGSSTLGVDSGTRVATKVTRHTLDQTSAELDYLCADILLGREAPAPSPLLPAAR